MDDSAIEEMPHEGDRGGSGGFGARECSERVEVEILDD